MRLTLTPLSEKKLLKALEHGGRRALYFRDNHGQLHSATLRAEVARDTLHLTLQHKATLHSIDLDAQHPNNAVRAADWIEGCANGREESA